MFSQVMQKAAVSMERAKDIEKELKEERKRSERAQKKMAEQSLSLQVAREEVEGLKKDNAELKQRTEELEHDLRVQLDAAQAKSEAEHDRAVLEVTENYRAQMPAVKDAIWEMAWRRCLTKLGVEESSPHWSDMELPSSVAAHLTSQPDPELHPELSTEEVPADGTITDLTVDEAVGGGNIPDPNSAIDASELNEEA
jgi:hypothetical protein